MVALSFFSPAVKSHAMLHEGGHVAGPQARRPGQSGRGAAQAACRLCQGKVSWCEKRWVSISMNHSIAISREVKKLTATLPSRWWPVSGHARCVHSWPTVHQATNSLRIRITPILGIGHPNNKLHHPLTSKRPKTGGKRSSQGGRGLESKIQFFRLRQ